MKIERLRDRLSGRGGLVALVAIVSFSLGALFVRACGGEEEPHRHEEAAGDAEATVWTCSMHPQIRREEPGACPICGMDLIPLGSAAEGAGDRVTLSERAKALAKVRTTAVRRLGDSASEIRLLGRVEADESASRTVTAWVGGRIDRLHVNVTGVRVRAGQVIATLYSPEVYAAHQDLLAAKRQAARMSEASEGARAAAEAAHEAARERLRLLGIPAGTIGELERASEPARAIPIRSPFAGTVIERVASEGAYVEAGAPLFRVARLGTVWVQLEAYERDLASVRVGQRVTLVLEALPDESFEGKVAFIDPTVDPARRTARVRVEVENPDGRLRPGMFAQGVVRADAPAGADAPLVVPRTAPLFTGKRSIVYVEVPGAERPTYEPRVVRLGPRAGEHYPVVAGLEEGERVVIRGAFVIDADLQIRGGPSMMTRSDDTDPAREAPIRLPRAERAKLEPVVEAYLDLQSGLADDDLGRARRAASALAEIASGTRLELPPDRDGAWVPLSRGLSEGAQRVARATSLESARGPFEELSARVALLLARFGNPTSDPLRPAFCPMAGKRGSEWIQRGEVIDNPYFGESMRECGELRGEVPPAGHLEPEAGGHSH